MTNRRNAVRSSIHNMRMRNIVYSSMENPLMNEDGTGVLLVTHQLFCEVMPRGPLSLPLINSIKYCYAQSDRQFFLLPTVPINELELCRS